MSQDDIAWLPAWRVREKVLAKELSPVEVTEHQLERIERLDPQVNSFITVAGERALEEAEQAEQAVSRGESVGPLFGALVGVKDQIFTEGIRSTGGSLLYKDFVPSEDSVQVERLRKAGATILGKTNCPEFGMHLRTKNRVADECVNPWDTDRTSGGSSGGSAVSVASGLVPVALGTDGSGSGRVPAAFCGVFGLHGSDGRVPRGGAFGGTLFTSGTGPMTRDVRDAATMLQAMAGPDPRDPTSMQDPVPDYLADLDKGVAGLRIAWAEDYGYETKVIDPAVRDAAHAAALRFESDLGAHVEAPELHMTDPTVAFDIIRGVDKYSVSGHLLEDPGKRPLLSFAVDNPKFEQFRHTTAVEYSRALRVRFEVIEQFRQVFERYDLIVTPTVTMTAPKVKPPDTALFSNFDWIISALGITGMINFTGLTAATVPCGFVDGLPVGLHIIGKRNDEATVLRASRAIEQALPWAQHRPPLATGAPA